MAGRTEQDISLYTLQELQTMLNRRLAGEMVIFSKKALEDEIERRLTDEA